MSSGHYTAYIKSNERWYCYDDSTCYEISPTRFDVEGAYMLFYMRKYSDSAVNSDLESKEPKDVFPPLEQPFRGKPVLTKDHLKGYLQATPSPAQPHFIVQPFTSKSPVNLKYSLDRYWSRSEDIIWESDEARAQELKTILEQSQKQLNQQPDQQPNPSRRRCLIY